MSRKMLVPLCALPLLLSACAEPVPPGSYRGGIAGSTALIAIHADAAGGVGPQRIRAWVSNGAPAGVAEWFDGEIMQLPAQLTSASGRATLTMQATEDGLEGTITLPDGVQRNYFVDVGAHGGGLYEVTVDAGGRWSGHSLSGWQLEARQEGVYVRGTLTGPGGESVPYALVDMSRAFEWDVQGGAPDTYTLFVCNRGFSQFGRGGGSAAQSGNPGANVIALDLWNSEEVTPGTYWGKVDGSVHQLMVVLDRPDEAQPRRVRVYLAGVPQPEGDTEWFMGEEIEGRFDLQSASGDAAIEGEVTEESVSGMVALPNGEVRRFFAIAAGDGAGIYDVTVTQEGGQLRLSGVSDNGNSFEFMENPESGAITGTVTLADGGRIDTTRADLTRIWRLPVKGSAVNQYVAFASPRAHDVLGRSGNVRGGGRGNDIIGLDKCD